MKKTHKQIDYGDGDIYHACGVLSYHPIMSMNWNDVDCKRCIKIHEEIIGFNKSNLE